MVNVAFGKSVVAEILTKDFQYSPQKRHKIQKNISLHRITALEGPYGFVFCNSRGNPLDPEHSIKRGFLPALRFAGLRKIRFHDLRHTFASHLVMAGVDLMTVKELLGHKIIEMTLRYSHLSGEHKAKAVQVLDNI